MSTPERSGRRSMPAGVIHDIGYRHYDGRRLGAVEITRALFLESLRGAYGIGRSTRSKIMPILLFGAATLPALIVAVVVNVTKAGELPVTYTEYTLTISAAISLYVAGQAPASVSRDLRFRVVSLYFSRPLSRTNYVRAKYAALTGGVFVLTAVPTLVLYAGALLAQRPFWAQTRGALTALVGAGLLAVVLAGLGLVIAAVTPRRGLGVAAVITVLVMASAVQGFLQALGQDQGTRSLQVYSGLVSPFSLVDHVLIWAFNAHRPDELPAPGALDGLVYVAVLIAFVAACYGLLIMRYRRVSVS